MKWTFWLLLCVRLWRSNKAGNLLLVTFFHVASAVSMDPANETMYCWEHYPAVYLDSVQGRVLWSQLLHATELGLSFGWCVYLKGSITTLPLYFYHKFKRSFFGWVFHRQYPFHLVKASLEMKTRQSLNWTALCFSLVAWTAYSSRTVAKTLELWAPSHTRLMSGQLMTVTTWHNKGWRKLRKKEKE